MYTRDFRWPACVAVLFVALEVLGWSRYGAGTVVWLACGALLIVCWPGPEPSRPPPDGSRRLAAALAVGVVAACGWALVVAAGRALPVVFAGPPDPIHGDMLPVVNLGVD